MHWSCVKLIFTHLWRRKFIMQKLLIPITGCSQDVWQIMQDSARAHGSKVSLKAINIFEVWSLVGSSKQRQHRWASPYMLNWTHYIFPYFLLYINILFSLFHYFYFTYTIYKFPIYNTHPVTLEDDHTKCICIKWHQCSALNALSVFFLLFLLLMLIRIGMGRQLWMGRS